MKRFKNVVLPAKVVPVCQARVCDLCGANGNPRWQSSLWNQTVNETVVSASIEIRQKEGFQDAESGQGTEYEVDLCPKCFKEKLIPWLQSQNPEIKSAPWEW